MMEGLARSGDIGTRSSEAKSSFDPDARIGKVEDPKTFMEEKKSFDPDARIERGNEHRQKELTPEDKDKIKKEMALSDEVIDDMNSMEEYHIYKDAGLEEKEIDGRKCLVNPNIDMAQKDPLGRTNKERMEQGLAPLDKKGNPMELHHIGQHNDSPLAELTQEQHRGKENYSILHDTKKESEIDRVSFNDERANHWKARSKNA